MKVLNINEVIVLLNESTVMSCFCYAGLMWASIIHWTNLVWTPHIVLHQNLVHTLMDGNLNG